MMPLDLPGLADPRAVVFESFIAAFDMPPERTVSEWAADERRVAAESGSPFPGPWSNDLCPFWIEPMNRMTLSDPAREIALAKSAQTGGSENGLNLFGKIVVDTPCSMLIILPTIDEGKKYNRVKLQPAITETPSLRRRVLDVKSRDATGSTTAMKKFKGGFAMITGANSSVGLQMISARVIIYEEISEWPWDTGGRGDPMKQAENRAKAYRDTVGDKHVYISTPGILGSCRITAKYEAGTQSRYYVPCPRCGWFQNLVFKQVKVRQKSPPYGTYYECRHCNGTIEHHEKKAMIAAVPNHKWVPCYPDAETGEAPPDVIAPEDIADWQNRSEGGRQPSYHVWQAYSPFVAWEDMMVEFFGCKDKPDELKTFVQQALGEPWEEKGDAPKWQRLFARREDYPARQIPVGGLIFTAAVDIGATYARYEIKAHGEYHTTWSIDIGHLSGDTADPESDIWKQLTEVYERRYPDAYGNVWPVDLFGVDAGYNTNQVYTWVRAHPQAMALDGRHGWGAPALGTPTKQDITFGGRKIRRGVDLWPVGTFSLKSALYASLRKDGIKDGAESYPPGFSHHSLFHDEKYFKELTAEYLKKRSKPNGQVEQVWMQTGDNHYLDCDIYNRALAEHLGVSKMTADDWTGLAAERGAPPKQAQGDLLTAIVKPSAPTSQSDEVAEPNTNTTETPQVQVRGAGGMAVRGS